MAGTTGAGGMMGGLPGAILGDALAMPWRVCFSDRMQRQPAFPGSDDFKALVEQATQETVPAAP